MPSRSSLRAEERGLTLMVGHLLQYHPAFLAVRRLVADGALGELRYLYSNRLNLGPVPPRGEHPVELRSARPVDAAGAGR